MKYIEVGLSRAKGFGPLSKAIGFIQDTDYSHAFLRFYSSSMQRHLIYQATGSGVAFMNQQTFDKKSIVTDLYKIEVTDEQYNEVLRFCVDQNGKPYGFKNLLLIGWFYITGHKMSRGDGEESFICSELVGEVFKKLNMLYQDVNIDYYTPKNVFWLLELQRCFSSSISKV